MDLEKRRIVKEFRPEDRESVGLIVLTEPTELGKEMVKQQLLGEHARDIHPDILETLVEGINPEHDITLDPQVRDAILFGLEAGIKANDLLRYALDAIARTTLAGESEVSIDGPGGREIREIEEKAFTLLDRRNQVRFTPSYEPTLAERMAKAPEMLNPEPLPKDMINGVDVILPSNGNKV